MSEKLVRLSLSIDESLFKQFERLVEKKRYNNRSEFVRDMIREQLVQERWQEASEIVGTITLVYNHHKRELSEKLTDLQHHSHELVLASTHVHLSDEICAEMIMVRGYPGEVSELADRLGQQRGVLHSNLTMSSADFQPDF